MQSCHIPSRATVSRLVRRLIGRDIAFPQILDPASVLDIEYSYRLESPRICYLINGEDKAALKYDLYTFRKGKLGQPFVSLTITVDLPIELQVDMSAKKITVQGHNVSASWDTVAGRRFVAICRIQTPNSVRERKMMHYLAQIGRKIDEDYYTGDDYEDYEKKAHTDAKRKLAWIQRFCSQGSMLDVGCATGRLLQEVQGQGFTVRGIDVCEYAIQRAAERVGRDAVAICNLDEDQMPFKGSFDVIIMADVIEHLADPESGLQKILNTGATGCHLFLTTLNSNSLTHRMFGDDWEGYSDYSHKSADWPTSERLRTNLKRLGWSVKELSTTGVWIENIDPLQRGMSEAYACVPAFRELVDRNEWGDFLSLVAIRLP